jgi:hypothetical protein
VSFDYIAGLAKQLNFALLNLSAINADAVIAGLLFWFPISRLQMVKFQFVVASALNTLSAKLLNQRRSHTTGPCSLSQCHNFTFPLALVSMV